MTDRTHKPRQLKPCMKCRDTGITSSGIVDYCKCEAGKRARERHVLSEDGQEEDSFAEDD